MENLWDSKMKALWEKKKRVLVMEALAREYWWSMLHLNSKVARTFFHSQATSEKSRKYWPLLNRRCASVVVSRWPNMIGDKK